METLPSVQTRAEPEQQLLSLLLKTLSLRRLGSGLTPDLDQQQISTSLEDLRDMRTFVSCGYSLYAHNLSVI